MACQPVLPDVPRPDGGPRVRSYKHAHNDYEHPRPLFDALAANFESVEVDLFLNGDDIGVSHIGPPFKGSLKSLYLEPMAQRVRTRGAVGDPGTGGAFFLWLDLKQGDQKLLDLVAAQLAEYPMLTRFEDEGAASTGAVTVIITGHDAGKKALASRPGPRPYARDSNSYSPMDPPADNRWGAYALSYPAFFSWNGQGPIPPAQQRQLENLVHGVHALGRQLRLYGCPETKAWWRAAKQAGVDFVGGDDLTGIAEVFAE